MLAIGRYVGQGIYLDTKDGRVFIQFVKNRGGRIVLGIEAPKSVEITRTELTRRQR